MARTSGQLGRPVLLAGADALRLWLARPTPQPLSDADAISEHARQNMPLRAHAPDTEGQPRRTTGT
jgi:hypothetical protein